MFELSVTRLIDALRDTVYRVYTERTQEWFAPKPHSITAVDWDLRAGGRAFLEMDVEGSRMPMDGVFLEVVPGEKLVSTDAFTPGWAPQGPFMVSIVTFEEEEGKTRYTARARHWSEDAQKQHEDMGFEQGWGQVADQLKALCEEG